MRTIFVQIAAYRDRELLPTLRDCLDKAARPNDLRFGIYWQYDESESLEEFAADQRFRVVAVHYRESKGTCWARHTLQSLYSGEAYTLQLDSHHRFIRAWDDVLIRMLEQIDSKKPLLTSYAPAYDPAVGPLDATPCTIGFDHFTREGLVAQKPLRVTAGTDKPIPARFYSAHFAFAHGSFCAEVRHDPELYFHGEEINIAVRAFTHGYDLFHPHVVIVWHEYTRNYRPKHWDDHAAADVGIPWHFRDRISQRRCRILLGIDDGAVDFGEYALGSVRTLDDYQRYSGIHFRYRLVQRYTVENSVPPNSEMNGLEEWHAQCLSEFSITVALYRDRLPPAGDWDFWYVGVHDEWETELYRCDLGPNEIYALLGMRLPLLTINYSAASPAATWTVWPHSCSRGWLTKITGKGGPMRGSAAGRQARILRRRWQGLCQPY